MFAKIKKLAVRAVVSLGIGLPVLLAVIVACGTFSQLRTIDDAQAVAAEAPVFVDPLAPSKIDISTGTLIVVTSLGETQTVKIAADSRVYLVKAAPAK